MEPVYIHENTSSMYGKRLTRSIHSYYTLTMRIKDKPDGQNNPTFTEAARRTQIIECAIETLATLGYAQASLAQIAKRAGISKGVIVYYFSSKEELFEQVRSEEHTSELQSHSFISSA